MYGSNDMNVKGALVAFAIVAASALFGFGVLIGWWLS